YGSHGDRPAASAQTALRDAIDALLRLLAPIVPFATEEAWSWWHDGSIHAARWPEPSGSAGDPSLIDTAIEVLGLVRRTKTEAKVSQRAAVASIAVTLPADRLDAFEAGRADLVEAGSIGEVTVTAGDALAVGV